MSLQRERRDDIEILRIDRPGVRNALDSATLELINAALKAQLADLQTLEYRGRKVAEDISLALQGALMVRHGHPAVAEAFLVSRLDHQWGGAFGTLPTGLDLAPIIERALVKG